MFMMSKAEVPFRRIILYKKGIKAGWFYCPLVLKNAVSWDEGFFYGLDIMKYIPKILNNIAIDSGNKITKSIPLGHLGGFDTLFSSQRFLEQVMAFEYLFNKLDHKKEFVKNNDFTGKTVIPFATSASSGFGESGQLLADMAGTGDWQEGMRFDFSPDEAEVQEWVNGLGL